MKRILLLIACVTVFVAASASLASPVGAVQKTHLSIPGLESRVFTLEFKGGQRANVNVLGAKANTNLGLYVYDEHGNCVAWDDEGTGEIVAAAAIEWYPPKNGIYSIEIRNNGFLESDCKLYGR